VDEPTEKLVAARLPIALFNAATRHADLYHTSVSALLREGLTMRLHGGPQPSMSNGITPPVAAVVAPLERLAAQFVIAVEELRNVCQTGGAHAAETTVDDTMSNGITTQEQTSAALPDVQASDPQRAIPPLPPVTPRRARAAKVSDRKRDRVAITSDTKADVPPIVSDTKESAHMPDVHECMPAIMSDTHEAQTASPPEPALLSDRQVPAFDTTKYILGQLCPRGHDYYGTGQSLRRLPRRVCPQCDTEQTRERRQSQHQGPPDASRATPAPAPARRPTRTPQRA
jgi:hypothetical protein